MSYLSHTYYKATKALHKLPKFTTTCTGIKIGNGSIVQVLFVILLLFMWHGHVFEIYTIVADIDDGIDLVFGFKNMVETEGMLNTRTGEFDFLGRSIPIFPKHDLNVKPGGKAYLKSGYLLLKNYQVEHCARCLWVISTTPLNSRYRTQQN